MNLTTATWTETTDLGFSIVRLHDSYTWTETTELGFPVVRLHETYTWTEVTALGFSEVRLHDGQKLHMDRSDRFRIS